MRLTTAFDRELIFSTLENSSLSLYPFDIPN